MNRRIFETMLNGVAYHRILVDGSGRPVDYEFLDVNEAFELMTGIARDTAIGRRATEVLPGIAEDDAGWIARYGAVALTGTEARFERYSDTLGRWYSVVAYCPEPGHFVTIFEDITERVEAVEAQRESERALNALVANLPGMAYRCLNAPGWPMDYVSEGATELTGHAPDALVADGGVVYGDLIHPEDRTRVWDEVQAAIAGRSPFTLEYRITAAEGSVRHVWEKGRAVMDPDGEVVALEGFVMDVTDRRKAEERAVRSQRLESIGRLAGGVAHDFNNMLSVIVTYAELIGADRADDTALLDDLGEIHRAAERAQTLTRQLLAFSRRQVLEPVVLDLGRTVAEMEKLLRSLLGEDIDLRFDLPTEIWRVLADPGQIEQIVMNLAVNARDAMPEGGRLTIETCNVELGAQYIARHGMVEPGRYVMLAVSDTGHGMDEQVQARIFEPFFTTKTMGRGTGLGLATVYGIVKQSGGYVWVYSEEGRGTTFKVYLPCTTRECGAPEPAHPFPTDREARPVGVTLLIVEDEEAFLQALGRGLGAVGYTVLLARNGEEAERVAREHRGPLDLLLTDMVLPGIGGRLVADAIRALHPGVEVLFMSGYTSNGVVHQGILDEGVPFLQKPFTAAKVDEKLRRILRAKPAGAGEENR